MVTVTSVGRLGQVTGIYAKGPPNRNTYDQTPSSYANFNGKLSEDGLKFDTGGWKHEYRIMPDGSMVGRLRFDRVSRGSFTPTMAFRHSSLQWLEISP